MQSSTYAGDDRKEVTWRVMVMKRILAAVPVALLVLAAPAHADQQTFLADIASEGGFGGISPSVLLQQGNAACGAVAAAQRSGNPLFLSAARDAIVQRDGMSAGSVPGWHWCHF